MTSSERVGHLLVALPIAHVLGASLFLWSYCLGFGSNIVAHATLSDLLSVSIRDMVSAYIVSLLYPAVLSAIRLSRPLPYAIDRARAVEDEHRRSREVAKVIGVRRGIITAACIGAVVALAFAAYQAIMGDRVNYFFLQAGVTIGLAVFVMVITEQRGDPPLIFETATIVCVFAATLFFQGLDRGQADRWRTYEEASKRYTMCNRAIILRSLSTNFLAVLPGDHKALISPECKVKYRISDPKGAVADLRERPLVPKEARESTGKPSSTQPGHKASHQGSPQVPSSHGPEAPSGQTGNGAAK